MQEYQFNRVAEQILLVTLKYKIIEFMCKKHMINDHGNLVEKYIDLDPNDIFLNSPFEQYVNNRTELKDNESEEARYPSLAIYSVRDEDISPMSGYETQILESGEMIKVFQSDYVNQGTFEFVVSTIRKSHYMSLKQKLQLFFREFVAGMELENDLLPIKTGISIVLKDVKSDTETNIMTSVFTVNITYRIFKEYLAYALQNYELFISADLDREIDREINVDDLAQEWSRLDPYLD